MGKDELTRLKAQRDRAWRALQSIQDAIGRGQTSAVILGLHLAGCIGPADADEWNTVDRKRLTGNQGEAQDG